MANGNGDMRRALEACTLALKLCTDEAAEAAAEAAAQQAAQQVAQQPGKRGVGMRQMAAALSRVTGGLGWGGVLGLAVKWKGRHGVAAAGSLPESCAGQRQRLRAPGAPTPLVLCPVAPRPSGIGIGINSVMLTHHLPRFLPLLVGLRLFLPLGASHA